MCGRVGLVFLFVLTASYASDAREFVTTDIVRAETVTSDVTVLQLTHHMSEWKVQGSKLGGRNEDVCTMCEEFATDALNYLADNKTQADVMEILHKGCSRLFSFKKECITMVDYYASLFFVKISSVQPQDICGKFISCEEMVYISRALSLDSCELCHRAVVEVLLKLKDPDTQLEIIELLLKGCDAAESYIKKCKRVVFEYGPLIVANAEQFLETTDICDALHACHLPPSHNNEGETYAM